METTLAPVRSGQQKLAIDWTESEWFQVWLRLARHEHENNCQPALPAAPWAPRAAA